MKRMVFFGLVFCTAALALAPRPAAADCGSIPFSAPLEEGISIIKTPPAEIAAEVAGAITGAVDGAASFAREVADTTIKFDPLKVSVFEPRQRAIILWNGREETLLLSTDQRASQPTAVLEVIPLPSQPTVSLGDFSTFEVAQRLVVEKNMWATAHPGMRSELTKPPGPALRVTFQRKMGAHDLTVAEVLDKDRFTHTVQTFLNQRYQAAETPIRPEFLDIIQSYLDQGFRWFVFDVIALDTKDRSRQPVQYRFKSDKIFYPLRISSLEQGRTEADLLVFTAEDPTRFTGLEKRRFKIMPPADVTLREFNTLNPQWAGFFGVRPSVRMTRWTVEGKSANLQKDVLVQ